jgi:hypothetical protein
VSAGNILLDNSQGIYFKDSGGTARISFALSTANNLQLGGSSGTITGTIQLINDANIAFAPGSSGGYSEKVRITSTGNLGIGTTAPEAKLDVSAVAYSSNQAGGIRIGDTGGNWDYNIYVRSDAAGLPRLTLGRDSNEWLVLNNGNVGIGTVLPGTAGLAVMNGNVGIGTTAPDLPLAISPTGGNWNEGIAVNPSTGSGYGAIFFRKTAGSTTNSWLFGKSGTNDNLVLRRGGLTGMGGTYNTDSPFAINYATGNALFGANLGIGTTSPVQKLHVEGQCVTGDTLVAVIREVKGQRSKVKGGGDDCARPAFHLRCGKVSTQGG